MAHLNPFISCEFFPPVDADALQTLQQTAERLQAIKPEYFSVTYGAGGTTQERTLATVFTLQEHSHIPVAPHLTCIGSTRSGVREILAHYQQRGINRLVALRGDLPSGTQSIGELRYANELVEFVRASTGDYFHIEVAAYPEFHPQADSPERDLQHFQRKIQAGANAAITQYFFNADGYFRFLDDCQRLSIEIPIVPGIMPITNFRQLARFSDRCGAEIPRWLRQRLEHFGDDRAALCAFGEDVISALCQRLLDQGAPGLHFYSMNRADPTLAICRNLGLSA
jgi:methylenetetrahydrofolate reductase (NADPH)